MKIKNFSNTVIFAKDKKFTLHDCIEWNDGWVYLVDTAPEHADMSECRTEEDYYNEMCWIALLGAIQDNELEYYLYKEYIPFKDYIIDSMKKIYSWL